ncbi:MAG: TRAP transporter fused permease subunit [Chromatiaceae bacterium]|nr:TRAP transporter fused permease subunit [Chromatiaceae bacterium]
MFEKLNKIEQIIFDVLALFLVLFYSYSAVLEPASTEYHRGIYVLITYILVFMIYQTPGKLGRVVDYLLIAASVVTITYWIANFEVIAYRAGAETELDKWIAMVGVLIGIELARRVVGSVFVVVGAIMLLYGVYGEYAPELISHAGDTFPDLCTSIFYKSDGVFGIMANVLATYIILFVIFGAFLEASGAQRFFIDFPLAAVGDKIGGPAKVSVIASGLFGSISGSAIANTVSTGAFTIPMMKKAGFKPHVAGGIEPAASIGGMFMPPIMGAGGFIMAELTGVPYSQIMLVAIFPALMYFFSVFMMVHYEAKRFDIRGEKSETKASDIFRKEWIFIMPLVVITIFMLTGYSPGYSAILGLATCILVSHKLMETKIDLTLSYMMLFVLAIGWLAAGMSWAMGPSAGTSFNALLSAPARWITAILSPMIGEANLEDFQEALAANLPLIYGLIFAVILLFWRRSRGADIKTEMHRFVVASRQGTISSLKIGATVGVIGIIIGVLTYSGLVLTFADIVIELADGRLWLTILLVALASLVLGMGVPVTAAYLITAVVAVPALTELGVNPIAAHMIVYWLSQDSNITPPVCIAAFAGATIAGANMWKTAFTAFKFAKFLYLGPFLFGYVPAFSLDGSAMDIVIAFVLIIFGTWAYSWLLSGIWLKRFERKPAVA